MKKSFTFLALLFLAIGIYAEQLTIIVTSTPENTPPGDNIYVAGNFTGWNPGDPAFMLTENTTGQPEISFEATGSIEFKFTRGSWETVEGSENGGFLPNRSFVMGSADTLEIAILSWEDTGGTNHTAAENVQVMDEEFFIPQFNRYRRIWLYLPPDYETSGKNYPVLYMHDGQNLFDAATSFAGEWEVDETLNDLFAEGKDVPIVVGIDNGGGDRIDEYTPWPNPGYGGGDGELYAQFIVETLKPFIDENYRTKPERENTGVMGSSLGGLISHYIAIKHQDVFSKSGIFSPSYWFNDSVYDFTYNTGKLQNMNLYIMGGSNESAGLVGEMMAMTDTLLAAGFQDDELALKVVPGGQHNEALWRQEFGEAYEWLFFQSSIGVEIYNSDTDIHIKVINRQISIHGDQIENDTFRLELFSLSGQGIFASQITKGENVRLPSMQQGIYLARLSNSDFATSRKVFVK